MRHGKHGRKFGRQSGPRHALFSNMVSSLIEHERIKTTDAKAKELRRVAERTISWATSVGNLIENDKKDAHDEARIVHAMRMAQRVLKHKPSLLKLFNEIGPRAEAGQPAR
jgi:large subunit ribosomal protein L17